MGFSPLQQKSRSSAHDSGILFHERLLFSLHADFSMKNYFSFSQRHHRIALHFCGQLYDYDGYGCHTARSPTDLWDFL